MTKDNAKGSKVMISERAAYARINRALEKQGEALRRSREDSRTFHSTGRYFTVDLTMNSIAQTHCDLEDLGRELGILRDYETVEAID